MEAGFLKSLFEVRKMGAELGALVGALMGPGAAPGAVGRPGFQALQQEAAALRQRALDAAAQHLEQRAAVAGAVEDLRECERRVAGGRRAHAHARPAAAGAALLTLTAAHTAGLAPMLRYPH
jgi:hypothetical protein